MSNHKVAIIGAGNLGQSIISGLLENGFPAKNIYATRRHVDHLQHLADKGVQVGSDNNAAADQADLVLLAVKPYNIDSVVQEISETVSSGKHIICSLATAKELAEIRSLLPNGNPVFRAMPNITADIGKSITCIAHDGEKEEHVQAVDDFFSVIGKNVFIDEGLMEAATILGACGTAFVMRFIRAMIQGGIQIGFDAETAQTIVNHTVEGAAKHLILRDDHPEEAIDKVTTPKGCTIVGLNEMEHEGFSSSLIKGIVASYKMIAKD